MRIGRLLCVWLTLSGPVAAQTCQPFWSGFVYDNPQIGAIGRFVNMNDGSGPTIFTITSGTGQFDVLRWSRDRWRQLESAGLGAASASELADALIVTLDDGSGPKLYAYAHTTAARWDGETWSLMPPGFCDTLLGTKPLASVDLGLGPVIYGKHRVVGVGSYLARWNGSSWQDLEFLSNNPSVYLATFDDGGGPSMLLFAQPLASIAGIPCTGFAQWDGHAWTVPSTAWAAGFGGKVCFTVFDDGSGPALYTSQGELSSQPSCSVMKWDGHEWSCFANVDLPPFTIGGVNVLQVFDDGRGPALYIGGGFDGVNGHPAHNLIRYDGHSWEEVGGGVGLAWHSGIVDDPRGRSLMIGYDFGFAVGGGRVDGAALWTGCATPQCYANCDRSSQAPVLNILDFMCFINRFVERDPYANCTGDGAIDVQDFACFLNRFAEGCP